MRNKRKYNISLWIIVIFTLLLFSDIFSNIYYSMICLFISAIGFALIDYFWKDANPILKRFNKITRKEAIEKLKKMDIEFNRLTFSNGYWEVIDSNGDAKLFLPDFSNFTYLCNPESWSIKYGYLEILSRRGYVQIVLEDLSDQIELHKSTSWSIKYGYLEIIDFRGRTRVYLPDLSRYIGWYYLESWSIVDGYIEMKGKNNFTILSSLDLYLSKDIPDLISWSIKEGYIKCEASNSRIRLLLSDLSNDIGFFSKEFQICKLPETKEGEKIFSHGSQREFRSIKDLKEKIKESDEEGVLIFADSLDSFISEVLGFEEECSTEVHIDKFLRMDFSRCRVSDPYVIELRSTDKIFVRKDGFSFGFERKSGSAIYFDINPFCNIRVQKEES